MLTGISGSFIFYTVRHLVNPTKFFFVRNATRGTSSRPRTRFSPLSFSYLTRAKCLHCHPPFWVERSHIYFTCRFVRREILLCAQPHRKEDAKWARNVHARYITFLLSPFLLFFLIFITFHHFRAYQLRRRISAGNLSQKTNPRFSGSDEAFVTNKIFARIGNG